MEFQLGGESMVEERGPIVTCQRIPSHNATLPFDILGLVFHYVTDGYPINLRSLLFVCRAWHNAVCLHPTLWATIWVDHTLLTTFAPNHKLSEPLINLYIRSCLKRSGTVPLDIALYFYSYQLGSFTLQNNNLWSCLLMLATELIGSNHEHTARWRSFSWGCNKGGIASHIFAKLPSKFPVLEILRLREVRLDPSHIRMFPPCPQLEVVELYKCCYVHPLTNEHCLLVSELSFGMDGAWLPSDLRTLSQFLSLRVLTLCVVAQGMSSPGWPIHDVAPTEVQLPHLRCLHLRGPMPYQVVQSLVTPSLKILELDCYTCFEFLGDIALVHIVETLHIVIPDLHPNLSIHLPRHTAKLFQAATALKHLRMPKWFHNRLERNKLRLDEDVVVVIE
jgi:hypothetical protein